MSEEEFIATNDTAMALLRGLEGQWSDKAGAEVQKMLSVLLMRAEEGGKAVGGSFAIKVHVSMGVDGKAICTGDPVKVTLPKAKPDEGVFQVDRDGDLVSRKADPQLPLPGTSAVVKWTVDTLEKLQAEVSLSPAGAKSGG